MENARDVRSSETQTLITHENSTKITKKGCTITIIALALIVITCTSLTLARCGSCNESVRIGGAVGISASFVGCFCLSCFFAFCTDSFQDSRSVHTWKAKKLSEKL